MEKGGGGGGRERRVILQRGNEGIQVGEVLVNGRGGEGKGR